MTTAEEWSVTAGMETSVETEVKAGIPILAEAKVKVSVKVSVSVSTSRSTNETTKQSYSFPVKVPAGKHVQASVTIYEGNINTKYTAEILYALASGKSFSYNVTGD